MKFTQIRYTGWLLAMTVCMTAIIAGCAEPPAAASRPKFIVKTLTVLTPHNLDIQRAFSLGFAEWYQKHYEKNVDVEIDWVVKGTPKCVAFVRDWFTLPHEERPRLTPDVLFGGGVTDHQQIAEAGWTLPVTLGDESQQVPATIGGIPTRDDQGRWHATALARFGILYNKQVCESRGIKPPASWQDLSDPRFSGWLGIADPSASGTTQQSFVLILQQLGWDEGWRTIMSILANARALAGRSSVALDQVVTGESIAAFAINYDGQRRVAKSEGRLEFMIPTGVASVSPAVVSVLKSARQPTLAEAFVRYNLSEDGQKLWGLRAERGLVNAPTLYHYPIAPSMYEKYAGDLAVRDNPLATDLGRNVDLSKSRSQLEALEPLLTTATYGDNHLLLQRAWESLAMQGMPEKARRELTAPPMDEADAFALGRKYQGGSPYESAQLVNEWATFMNERFQRVLSLTH